MKMNLSKSLNQLKIMKERLCDIEFNIRQLQGNQKELQVMGIISIKDKKSF
jgi:hypothetical protein